MEKVDRKKLRENHVGAGERQTRGGVGRGYNKHDKY